MLASDQKLKVSIITIVYNGAETIEDAILSVKNQTYPNIEYIIIDGGSTDGTLEIVNKHQDAISLVVSEPDDGEYDADNKGIAASTGDIIGILSADDFYFHEEVIEEIVDTMEEKQVDVVYSDLVFVDRINTNKILRRYNSKNFNARKLAWGGMPAHPTLFVRRKIYEDYGYYNSAYEIAGDFEFIARIFSKNKLRYSYIPKVLVKMRMGGKSTSGWKNTIFLNKEVYRACRENGIQTNILKIYSKYARKIFEFILINKGGIT